MVKLIVANLRERPTRTFVSVLAVALGVALVLVSVGLANGQLTDHSTRIQKVGGDLILQPPNSSHLLMLSSASMLVNLDRVIRKIEGVSDVTPLLVQMDGFKQLYGVDPISFQHFNPNLKFLEGRMLQTRDETVVDTIYAEHNNVRLGDLHPLLGREFRVTGIFEAGTAVRVLIHLEEVQFLNGTPGKCSVFFIRTADPSMIPQVESELQGIFEDHTITRSSKLQEIWQSNTPLFRPFVISIVSIAVVVSFLIILLSMYSTITERTREIGILRSLGASREFIIKMILKESLLICGAGVAFGFALRMLGIYLVGQAFPTLPFDTPLAWKVGAPAMAVLGGTLGSFYPAFKAARLDPVRALGYE